MIPLRILAPLGVALAALAIDPALARSALSVDGGVVSAADPRAAAAGAAMLRAGGSATDAAIATMLALGVVEPQSSGIGGGGFLLTTDTSGRVDSFDGREAAPAAAGPQWFYRDGRALDHGAAVPGGRSVGVPGNLALAAMAHARHGRLPWARLFAPAIALARDGFVVTPRLAASLDLFHDIAALDPAARVLFFDAAGKPVPAGTRVRNPALAATLTRIARGGPRAFYAGPFAAALVARVNASPVNPAPLRASDLAAYHARALPPVCAPYHQWKVCSMGPPSAGGIIVLQVLGMLERFDLKALGPASPVAWHLIGEAERLAFADRDRFVGDPAFVTVPVAGLLDPHYIAARSALLDAGRTLPAAPAGSPAGADPRYAMGGPVAEHGTTHFVAVDRQGAVASYTSTVESGFGSGLMAGGAYLNNELTDFNLEPDRENPDHVLLPTANRVEGGKRPRSSMSPVIVFGPDGAVRLAGGAAGGATIPAQVIRLLVGTLDWGLDARTAIAQGVVMPTPDGTLAIEAGSTLAPLAPALTALGHHVVVVPMRLKANAVEHTATGWQGAADPRSEGASVSP